MEKEESDVNDTDLTNTVKSVSTDVKKEVRMSLDEMIHDIQNVVNHFGDYCRQVLNNDVDKNDETMSDETLSDDNNTHVYTNPHNIDEELVDNICKELANDVYKEIINTNKNIVTEEVINEVCEEIVNKVYVEISNTKPTKKKKHRGSCCFK